MVSPAFYCKLTLLWTEQGWWLLSKPDDKRLIRCSWHPENTSVTPRAAHDMERRTAVYLPREPSHMPPASAGPGSTPAPQAGKAAWTPTSFSFAVSGRGNFSSGWARTIPCYTVRTSRQIDLPMASDHNSGNKRWKFLGLPLPTVSCEGVRSYLWGLVRNAGDSVSAYRKPSFLRGSFWKDNDFYSPNKSQKLVTKHPPSPPRHTHVRQITCISLERWVRQRYTLHSTYQEYIGEVSQNIQKIKKSEIK